MTRTLHGKVHGKMIELDEDLGVAQGQEVEVLVTIIEPAQQWGDGIRRSAGAWANHPELDAVMQKIHEQRKLERRPQMDSE